MKTFTLPAMLVESSAITSISTHVRCKNINKSTRMLQSIVIDMITIIQCLKPLKTFAVIFNIVYSIISNNFFYKSELMKNNKNLKC